MRKWLAIPLLAALLLGPLIWRVEPWLLFEARDADNPLLGHWRVDAMSDFDEYYLPDRVCVESWGKATCRIVSYTIDGNVVAVTYVEEQVTAEFYIEGKTRVWIRDADDPDAAPFRWIWLDPGASFRSRCEADPSHCPIAKPSA